MCIIAGSTCYQAKAGVDYTDVSIVVPRGSIVGTRAAGLLCLPSGRLVLEDFVPDQDAFKEQVDREIALKRPLFTQPFAISSVVLVRIESKLCAKDYGVFGTGNKRTLYGSAKFSFEHTAVRNGSLQKGLSVIEVVTQSKDGLTLPEITSRAIKLVSTKLLEEARSN